MKSLLASLGHPGQAFGGLSWPPLADFGLTWRRLPCLGLRWPHLAWFRALPCPVVGVPNLRSYRPWRCFLRVRLLPSKRENGVDKGLQGRLWPGIWHPWHPFGRLLEANLATKMGSKLKEKSIRKFVAKIIENEISGPPKFGPFLRRKTW